MPCSPCWCAFPTSPLSSSSSNRSPPLLPLPLSSPCLPAREGLQPSLTFGETRKLHLMVTLGEALPHLGATGLPPAAAPPHREHGVLPG
mmetsp:Transcript_28320/g.71188  ORF Transcript_28320/g.71188 Transcript_28320/m.71188 type:complete len:89 (+) Transcript_28320:96-362(+)